MDRWFGEIGFIGTEKTGPGIWEEKIAFRKFYCGNVIRNNHRYNNADRVVDDITVSTKISILSDDFAVSNIHRMKYIEFSGAKWNIVEVEPQYPRLILTLGGVYTDNDSPERT